MKYYVALSDDYDDLIMGKLYAVRPGGRGWRRLVVETDMMIQISLT